MAPTQLRTALSALLLGLSVVLFVACGGAPIEVSTPSGFVALDDDTRPGWLAYKAVSADGAVLIVREQKNEDAGELEFWVKALSSEMIHGRGYELVATEPVSSGAGPGEVIKMRGSMDNAIYHYDVVLIVRPEHIYTVELAAPEEIYESRLGALESLLGSLTIN